MEITENDIRQAEEIFLTKGQAFDEERINFIKCIDRSLHLQACPGSGKTTALLAKLYILSEKMPLENNQGICVLTHTNVAIDIIKKRLGDKASKLLSYPNFFGTIQSFVDKYLAIPAYVKCFGYRPGFIDTEFFKNKIPNHFEKNQWLKNNRGKYETVIDFILFETKLIIDINQRNFKISLKNLKDTSKTFKDINSIITQIIRDGYLRFDDAYNFSKYYLENCPEIKNLFSSRFKYVFIDEAQDTSAMQKEIIEKCFKEKVIIQWIGDVNQGIMNDNYTESLWEPESNDRYQKIEFTTSIRISQPIADIVKNVSVTPYTYLNGNKDIDLKPILIIFDDNTVNNVLDKFAEILQSKKCIYDNNERTILEISQLSGYPIKAVGWVGKEKNNGLNIKSYFPDFDKQLLNIRKQYFPNLFTMCELSKNISLKEFKDRTLSCIIEVLNLSNIKTQNGKKFNKTELLSFMKEQNAECYNKLMECISKYYKDKNFNDFSNDVKSSIEGVSSELKLNKNSVEYLTEEKLKEVNQQVHLSNEQNVYKKIINGNEIKIFINTVHGVKGETHTATLYLETKYFINSIDYFINELSGNVAENYNKNKRKALKIAHVAFSRPTHLLCIAVYINQYQKISDKLNNQFEIIDITNKNNK